jgi:hypothetical protein
VASTSNVKVSITVGVPARVPSGLNVKPSGSVPTTEYVDAGVPLAEKLNE